MIKRSAEAKRSIRRRRLLRFAFRMNNLVALALLAALIVMVNYLSYRHYARYDLSRSTFYDLSDQTAQVLERLDARVGVYVFFAPDHALVENIERLLEAYQSVTDHIVVQMVDPNVDLASTRALRERFNLTQENVVVFDCEGRIRVVEASELVEARYTSIQMPLEPSSVSFLGELMFSSAIKAVAQEERPVIYVLQGHGEGDIDSFDEFRGYSDVAQAMRYDNLDVRPFIPGERKTIPSDAAAVLVLGPARKISQPELDLLRAYLDRRGRMLVLLEPRRDAGLEPLLADWGVAIHDDVVVDANTLTGPEVVVSTYEPHDITHPLEGISTIFYLPRSVAPAVNPSPGPDPADKPRVVPLLASSESGWAETDLRQNPLRYDPDADRPGPVPFAVAVEKGPVPGIDVEIQSTRLVVVGDADFVSNRDLSGGNRDLFLNMVNWLVERDDLMAISPKPFEMYKLVISRRHTRYLLAAVVGGVPAAVALLGILVWVCRRF